MTARTNASSLALLLLSLVGAGCAARSVANVGPTPALAPTSAADEEHARRRADALRSRLLSRAGWQADDDSCDPGALRIFPGDTTASERATTEGVVSALEALIVTYGLDAPPSPELLRTVIAWESNGQRPRWDVAAGDPGERRAIAPGLGGRFRNPRTGQCESYVALDTVTFVLPVAGRFEGPRVTGVRIGLIAGDSALRGARAAYFARAPRSAEATFDYARIGPLVTWGDYGLATVRRQSDLSSGAAAVTNDAVSASYLFHRAVGEWRLLAIARSW